MDLGVHSCDLGHMQREIRLIKSKHRSDSKDRGPARGEKRTGEDGQVAPPSQVLKMRSLEVRRWESFERSIWNQGFAARTNLVVYLIATRKVVVFGCWSSGGRTEQGK